MYNLWIGGFTTGVLAIAVAIFGAKLQTPGPATKKRTTVIIVSGLLVAVLSAVMFVVSAKSSTTASCEESNSCTMSPTPSMSSTYTSSTSATASPSVSPSASISATSSPSVSTSASSILYVSELDIISGNNAVHSGTDIVINQKHYPKSTAISASNYTKESWAEFNITSGYTRYTRVIGTLGHTDKSGSTCSLKATVQIDGMAVFSQDMAFGQEAPLDARINGGLRIKLLVNYISSEPSETNCNFGFGDIALVSP